MSGKFYTELYFHLFVEVFGDKGNKWYTSQNQNQIISFHKTLKIDKVHCANKYTSPLGVQCKGNLLPTFLKPLPPELRKLSEILSGTGKRK